MRLFPVFIYFSVNNHTFFSRNINVIEGDAYTLLGVLHNILKLFPNTFLKSEKPESQNILIQVFLDKGLCSYIPFLFPSAVFYLSRGL